MFNPAPPACFLFDNGSLRPEATYSLRAVARSLSARLGIEVIPVSLLHSSGVDPAQLNGIAAQLLEPTLTAFLAENASARAVALPLFFGPSAALTEYVPDRLRALDARLPQLRATERVVVADWLVQPTQTPADRRVAEALVDEIRRTMAMAGVARPSVILVDHGTPQPAVTAVREYLGQQVAALLGPEAAAFCTASMERREGDAYAFNEPLLERALRTPPFSKGDVVVALQFLAPGRHAGNDGDIAEICRAAEQDSPGLRTHRSQPLGAHPRLVEVLAERYRAAAAQTGFFGSMSPTSSA